MSASLPAEFDPQHYRQRACFHTDQLHEKLQQQKKPS